MMCLVRSGSMAMLAFQLFSLGLEQYVLVLETAGCGMVSALLPLGSRHLAKRRVSEIPHRVNLLGWQGLIIVVVRWLLSGIGS